uniref:RNA-directed DNA polymerase, eukaryota n=1 Tax=Tanacetum cinerariifolium TaxID=118510 RepID=A0A6L2NSC3_TANCI|nr:RNA-directed DNA polymerase, eukaryota [Tanacetum cinerariifolium]
MYKVNNLCTIWNDRLKLHANIARFHRNPVNMPKAAPRYSGMGNTENRFGANKNNDVKGFSNSYARVLKGHTQPECKELESNTSLVLDDVCLVSKDLSKALCVKAFRENVSVGSWFSHIEKATMEFMTEGRIAWVEVEGTINEDFKIIFWGKLSWLRAKETLGWVPDFVDDETDGEEHNDGGAIKQDTGLDGNETGVEEVPETMFEETGDIGANVAEEYANLKADVSEDPFNIYSNVVKEVNDTEGNVEDVNKEDNERRSIPNDNVEGSDSVCSGHFKKSEAPRRLAQKAKKDRVKELCVKYKVNFLAIQETKMEKMELSCVRRVWGNVNFEFAQSDSVGNSKGILCVWGPNSFRKKSVTASDYFTIIRGKWRHTGREVLFIVVYAPQDIKEQQILWDYLIHEIGRWNGEVVTVDDFNEKLKHLKLKIRAWNKVNRTSIKNIRDKHKDDLAKLDVIIDCGNGNDDIVNKRMGIISNIQKIDNIHSVEMSQKAKIKWSIEGDENLGYFHGLINKKRNLLNIRGVIKDGRWIDKPDKVKLEFFNHFSQRSDKPGNRRATIQMRYPRTLSLDQQIELESEVSNKEIKRADAKLVKDYRPISLIGSLYKIIAKIMANRLVGVLGDLVHEVQSAFIADRQILDGPMILNEVIQWCKDKKKHALIFKVDFEKAYDSSSRGSILINGSPTDEFQFFKGLKQGDSLSPFLFILIMESLHLSFEKVVDAGMFKDIQLSNLVNISHMFYADDAVFVGQWCDKNISTIIHVLECFHRVSGLSINMCKSKIMGINVDSDRLNDAVTKLGCLVLNRPFSYLGLIVGGSMSWITAWREVVDRVKNRLSKWKMKTLSIGGRLTLLKSILGSMPIYHMAMYRVPTSMLQTLESIRCQFFNGYELNSRKTSLVSWNKVLASKDKGGLGVSSFYALNRSMLVKWVWRFRTQPNSLWAKVIKAIHGINLLNDMNIKVGNGNNTSFWEDIWIGNTCFKSQFPRLYALENHKTSSVGLKLSQQSMVSSFRRILRGGAEQDQTMNIHAWKVKNDALATRFNLSRRGIGINSINCGIFDIGVETSDHLFFPCNMSRQVSRLIMRWWNVPYDEFESYEGWIEWFSNLRLPYKNKMMLEGVFYVLWWHLWTFRNRKVFDTKAPSKAVFYDENHLVEIQVDDHDLLVNSDNENDDMLGYESDKYFDTEDVDGTNHGVEANRTNHSDQKLVKRGITRQYKFRKEYGKPGGIKIKRYFDVDLTDRKLVMYCLGQLPRNFIMKLREKYILPNLNTPLKLNELPAKYSAIVKAEEWVEFVNYTTTDAYKEEADDKIKEGTLNLDDGTDAMTVMFGKEKGGYAKGMGSGVTYKRRKHQQKDVLVKKFSTEMTEKDVLVKKLSNEMTVGCTRGAVEFVISIASSLRSCIPDIRNNGLKTVKDSIGGFFAWLKNQVVLDEEVTPPTTIQKISDYNFAPKLQSKRKNYVSRETMQREARTGKSHKSLNYVS